ncbi:Isochorismatase-like protein [Mariannaea sp. PMI_226]|nr:Isochorismatase-like protein [Mariannaea sp. PMI_226]
MSNPAPDLSSPFSYNGSTTALLLLDFHSLLVDVVGGAKAAAAVSVAANMRTWAKSQGITVIHALIDIDDTPFPTCKDAKRILEFAAAMKKSGAEESPQLGQSLDDNEVMFKRKPGYVSALKSPGIEEFLAKKGIKSLIMTGLSTSGCVLRTAYPAADAEFVVSVISDACADRDEEVHELVLKKLLPSRAHVGSASQFQQEYENARPSE